MRVERRPIWNSPIRAFLARTNLLTRLAFLVVAATIPAVIVLINFQGDLQGQRDSVARETALHEAEVVSLEVGNIIAGASQVMTAMAEIESIRTVAPSCGERLARLRARLPSYVFLTELGADGGPACASSNVAARDGFAELARRAVGQRGIVVGGYSPASAGFPGPFICFAQAAPFEPGQPPLVMVSALSLDWLAAQLAEPHRDANGSIVVADAGGTLLAVVAATPGRPGAKLQPDMMPLLSLPTSGSVVHQTPGGQSRVIGYVPPTVPSRGLFVAVSFEEGDLVANSNRTASRGYLLIGLGAALSVIVALLAGNRLVRSPTLVLLDAARRWGDGDLTGRAAIPFAAAAEFQNLGTAFNGMAETLERQRAELQALNEALEIRVSDRTRALLDSNNRLQVEIAERELTEANLRQAQKLQAVGQLAGGIAHDFNNLLTAILGSLELIRKRLPGDDPRQSRLLDTAMEAVARGSRLTSQLLAFSRKQPLLAVPTDVAAAIEAMGGLLSSTLGPGVRLELRLPVDLWPAMLDHNQFEAAILNLALNARDAMPRGGRLTIAAVNLVLPSMDLGADLAAGDYLRVIVADTGIGMDPPVLARVFEPFFTTKGPGDGSGLGLSQVHGMVRQSGGDVQIESRVGDGTRVIMLLPRSADPVTAPANDGLRTVPALGQDEAILLVDDDAGVRDVTAAMLADNGYQVVTATDGEDGLAALRREGSRIRIAIADYVMPGMTGRDLLGAIRRERPDLPVLLATGYADYDALTEDGLPPDQIIRKPFRAAELLARIQMVHARARSGG